jgi:magnesium transporter
MFGAIIEPEIRALIAERNFTALRETFSDWDPVDLAELIADLPEGERVIIFRLLPHTLAAETFEYLDLENQQHLLRAMGQEQAAGVLNEMSPDDRTALLEELPGNVVTQLLRLLSPEERGIAQTLLNYPEGTVGRLMTPYFLSIHDEWTVQEVLDFVRKHGSDSETLNVLYVVNENGRLIDDVRIREFLIRPTDVKVADIREDNLVSLRVTDPQQAAVEVFKKYDRATLPVVDGDGKMVGIVTVDDVLDVAEEETTKDIQKIGGLEALDEPYMTIPLLRMIKKRGTWLVILFFSEMLTAVVMGFFEHTIQKAVVLAVFLPLIISSGGNSGSQASTLIIRAMAVGEVRLRDWWRVMRKEIASGLWLGVLLGGIGFLRIAMWEVIFEKWKGEPFYGEHSMLIGATIGISLIGVVLWGSLAGSMLPFVLRKLGFDPATSSAPFVATIVDVTGLLIYFTVAITVLRGTVL